MKDLIKEFVAWGHDFDDYCHMFALDENALQGNILEYSFGPSSFASTRHAKGKEVVACSPVYSELEKLKDFFQELIAEDFLKFSEQIEGINLVEEKSIEKLFADRQEACAKLLSNIDKLMQEKIIQAQTLPSLSFGDNDFDLVLCSHALFYPENHLDLERHIKGITELARVGTEVRVFPLVTRNGEVSEYMGPVMSSLQEDGYGVEVKAIQFEEISGGNAMMRVWNRECPV